jgi:hypothetical protein
VSAARTRVTRAQLEALRDVYRRQPMEQSFLGFRRSVAPTFGCDDAVVVRWAGMWLCIETDGYVHS